MGSGSIIKEDKSINYDPISEIKNGKMINLYPNHNVSEDTIASKILFDEYIPTRIISHSVASKFLTEGPVIDFLKERANNIKDINNSDDPEGVAGLLMNEWFSINIKMGDAHMILLLFMKQFMDGVNHL